MLNKNITVYNIRRDCDLDTYIHKRNRAVLGEWNSLDSCTPSNFHLCLFSVHCRIFSDFREFNAQNNHLIL